MTDPTRDTPGIVAPPPLIYLGLVAAGVILDSFWPLPLYRLPFHPLPGIATLVVGLALSAWSVLEFVRHGTNPDPYRATTAIITTGPYRWSRNPIYVAFAIMHIAIGMWSAKTWVLISLLPAALLVRYGVIGPEERYLERRFGETYLTYRRSVRRWIGRMGG